MKAILILFDLQHVQIICSKCISVFEESRPILRAAIKSNYKLALYSLGTGNIFSEKKKTKNSDLIW